MKSGSSLSGEAGLKLDTVSHPEIKLSANASGSREQKSSLSLSENIGRCRVRHFSTSGKQCWEVMASTGGVLSGKAWDPVLEPRLRIKRISPGALDPVARLIIKCRREDIHISGVAFKSAKILDRMPWQITKNKEVAAAAFIKEKLISYNLEPSDFDEGYSSVIIADMTVAEEII